MKGKNLHTLGPHKHGRKTGAEWPMLNDLIQMASVRLLYAIPL